MNIDPRLQKQIPMSPHKKEIAVFTFKGIALTTMGFLASMSNGIAMWILWAMFAFSLFQLGADYNKVLQRPDEDPLTVLKP